MEHQAQKAPQGLSVSVVIPVYNEEGSIAALFEEVKAVCEEGMDGVPFRYEIIIVNDGSTDGTDAVCRTLAPLTYIRLAGNCGQTAAMDCGFKHAKGDFVIPMDGDGQNDPADIPKMLRYLLDNDLDVVSGWRKDRKDPPGKRLASRAANVLRTAVAHDGIHDSGCTLKVYRRECFEELDLFGEQHRFIPALLKTRGFTVGEIPVNHRPRRFGKTKYGMGRIVRGVLDLLGVWYGKKYASRPLHLFGGLGLASFAAALVTAVVTVVCLFLPEASASVWGILTVLLCLGGFVLTGMGLISETLMAVRYRDGRHPYRVKETAVFAQPADGPKAGAAEEDDEDPDVVA